ncbi:PREDICTED: OTU domain-containing protein 6B-like [Papilio xuthus]|uniref:ubiquitinyl hydrolase 1 n=2 Tax=Papilio xuthus TaxID=66420 RepID=A0AAJ6ZAH9_PAPXU|nr:PREDICTED: OTU domain-containing protein 6B-like [Papilio xuthus]
MMADYIEENNEVEMLENKHKKEKKELQAHIQALKKVAKNDKTKKKELTAEIVRLELELEDRQKKEIEEVSKELSIENGFEQTDENEEIKVKLSKAQKRRVKKEQQEREREQEIKLQEKENINGPRNLENQAICNRLKEMNLKVYPISSDGDCLYKAVSHQLLVKRKQSLSVEELRKQTSNYIRENKEDFMPFLSHPETCDMLTDGEFEEYCEKIVNSKVWGGQIEIRALSNNLKCPISIIQATGPSSIEQGEEFEGPSLVITYHRHMYRLGAHYNSTLVIADEEHIEN